MLFRSLKEKELSEFAVREAERNGLILSSPNARYLGALCDGDLQTLVGEMGKLTSVCRGNISKDDLETYVAKSLQYNAFRLHDLFCARNESAARILLEKMMEQEPNPVGVISLIAGNFKQMLVARACRDAGFSESKTVSHIMQETNAKDWTARRALQHCKTFSAAALQRGIKILGQMDFDAKQGIITLRTDFFAELVRVYNRNDRP